jgi:hypothetical protein
VKTLPPLTNWRTGKDYCRTCMPTASFADGFEPLTIATTAGQEAHCYCCGKQLEVPHWNEVYSAGIVEHFTARIF